MSLLLACTAQLQAEPLIRDGDVTISRAEFERIVAGWSGEMRRSAANDEGDRLELIGMAVMNKRLAQSAEKITEQDDPDAYWELRFKQQRVNSNFMVKRFVDTLEIPDMSELAEERYTTEKDKYALVPEQRLTSHILFVCPPGQCDREPVREQARDVLQQLRDGADFGEMVEKYSGDPGSKKKGGLYDKWFRLGEKGVEPRYTGGAFDIAEEGQYSDLVETQFGVHIIRLDGIKPEHYLPFEEVKERIERALGAEFTKLAMTDFEQSMMITEDARIDGSVMEEIFAPYKTDD
ncbi:hypothetical protein GCM10027297_20050 [Parahaliea aestuarii]